MQLYIIAAQLFEIMWKWNGEMNVIIEMNVIRRGDECDNVVL
jgi:hypothetical protein